MGDGPDATAVSVEDAGAYDDAPPPVAAPETQKAAAEPATGGRGGGIFRTLVLSFRSAEVLFCLIAFSLMASSNYFQGSSALSYGLAAPIIGFIYSLALLVAVIIAFSNAGVANLLQQYDWIILISDFVAVILMLPAGAAVAAITSSICGNNYLYFSQCGSVEASAAFSFLAGFAYVADFWLALYLLKTGAASS